VIVVEFHLTDAEGVVGPGLRIVPQLLDGFGGSCRCGW
jgi:hypothetical protein